MITLLRAAGLEWSEQGDVWARVEAARPLPGDIPAESVTAMTGPLRRLLSIDATPSLAPEGSLASEAPWITGLERQGRALGNAGREGQLSLGTHGVLARHVLFHWDRLGFSYRRQPGHERHEKRSLEATDVECVMSSWWGGRQSRSGEAAVEDVVAVLEPT